MRLGIRATVLFCGQSVSALSGALGTLGKATQSTN
jgi:hypothetical protein